MCNHVILVLLLIIPISLQAVEKSSWWRFHRLLRFYDNPVFRAGDRDLFLRADYSANRNDMQEDESFNLGSSYLRQEYNLSFNGSTGFDGRWIRSKPQLQSDQSLSLEISGLIDKKTRIKTNNLTGTYDSLKSLIQKASGTLTYDGSIRRYLLKGRFSRYLFLEGGVNLNVSGDYLRDRSSSHYIDRNERLNYELEKMSNYFFKTRLFPAIGCGKRLPVRPVYTAFEIERNLRKLKALESNLSNSTMMRIAELCGSLDSFQLTRERPDKYIMSALDSILRDDPALDTSNYDAFSLFKVHEALTERFFLLFHGFEIRIRTELYFDGGYYSYLPPEEKLLQESRDVGFGWVFGSPVQFAWTFPVSPCLFIEYVVSPPSYSGEENLLCHYSSLKLYYFLTNRILLDFSVNDFSTFSIVPNGKPGNILFSALFFLEDKLTLRLSAEKRFRSTQKPLPWSVLKDQSERLTLQVGYDF